MGIDTEASKKVFVFAKRPKPEIEKRRVKPPCSLIESKPQVVRVRTGTKAFSSAIRHCLLYTSDAADEMD